MSKIRKLWKTAVRLAGPRTVRAALHRHRYAQIVPLGRNCEVAYRFFLRWGFVDSSVFAWSFVKDIPMLVSTLKSLDRLPSGEFELAERKHMWLHRESGVLFHGKLSWKFDGPLPPEDALRSDLSDLRKRLAHLVDKLKRYIANDEETLLIYKLADEDVNSGDLGPRLDSLEKTLDGLGARNWQLLIICQDADMKKMPKASQRRIYRSVREFNPGSRVTWPELGDPAGWHALFTEFAPKTILKKAHAFKFE